jgi:predicted metal-dependent phosphoesterase TrpH
MAPYVDLHIHSDHSDGTLSVTEILAAVRKANLAAFALTDHDTLEGYRELGRHMRPGDPELVCGVELSVQVDQSDMHLLAYLFGPEDKEFNDRLNGLRQARARRAQQMVDRLAESGVIVDIEEVLQIAGNAAVGRPHLAEAMLRLGITGSFGEAFRRYIGKDGPAYVPKARLEPAEAIDLIHAAGGVAVLAHPMVDNMLRHVEELAEMGLDGIEVYHYTVSRADVDRLKKLARRLGLLPAGGSDFHGREGYDDMIGRQPVPVEYLSGLKKRSLEIRGQH